MKKGLNRVYINIAGLMFMIAGFALVLWAEMRKTEIFEATGGFQAIMHNGKAPTAMFGLICGGLAIALGLILNIIIFIRWNNKNISAGIITILLLTMAALIVGFVMTFTTKEVDTPKHLNVEVKWIWPVFVMMGATFLGITAAVMAFFQINAFAKRAIIDESKHNSKSSDNALELDVK